MAFNLHPPALLHSSRTWRRENKTIQCRLKWGRRRRAKRGYLQISRLLQKQNTMKWWKLPGGFETIRPPVLSLSQISANCSTLWMFFYPVVGARKKCTSGSSHQWENFSAGRAVTANQAALMSRSMHICIWGFHPYLHKGFHTLICTCFIWLMCTSRCYAPPWDPELFQKNTLWVFVLPYVWTCEPHL